MGVVVKMADLTSLVITVMPAEPAITHGFLGRAVYGLFLDLVSNWDILLAESLHAGEAGQPKPFTCSTLVGGKPQHKDSRLFLPGELAWFRITGLNKTVSACLQEIVNHPPIVVELDQAYFEVVDVTTNPNRHPWAGATSYEDIARKRGGNRSIQLEFASPTTFRSRKLSRPTPMPEWVFGSLARRWEAFSGVPLPADLRAYVALSLVLKRYKLHTLAIPLKHTEMGCVGEATYGMFGSSKHYEAALHWLATYAFYSGVGYQTTVGLGQTRQSVKRKR